MSIVKNTRLIDLTVADLMVIIKECMTGFMPVDETLNDEDEIGGYEIAETINRVFPSNALPVKICRRVTLYRFTRRGYPVFKKDVNELVAISSKAYALGNRGKSGNPET
jgi:hypothetical protein